VIISYHGVSFLVQILFKFNIFHMKKIILKVTMKKSYNTKINTSNEVVIKLSNQYINYQINLKMMSFNCNF
jgi:hypothetical protein